MTVFNRGRSDGQLSTGVERLYGDRSSNLAALEGRSWDTVVDLSAYGPGWVRSTGRALGAATGHYVFISTNAVYDSPDTHPELLEDGPLRPYEGAADAYSVVKPAGIPEYGALKAPCELEAHKMLPGRTLVLRPGWVFGPGKFNAPFVFLLARMRIAGEVLAAGEPSHPAQFIDVRDLVDWAILMIEHREIGTYNIVGPATSMDLGGLLQSAAGAANRYSCSITWVDPAWLTRQQDRCYWANQLFWTFESDGYGRLMRTSIERALEKGLATRPVETTMMDTFAWHNRIAGHRMPFFA